MGYFSKYFLGCRKSGWPNRWHCQVNFHCIYNYCNYSLQQSNTFGCSCARLFSLIILCLMPLSLKLVLSQMLLITLDNVNTLKCSCSWVLKNSVFEWGVTSLFSGGAFFVRLLAWKLHVCPNSCYYRWASFPRDCMQTRLLGQFNGKWPISLVYESKPLIIVNYNRY